jgi:hypothetical protein
MKLGRNFSISCSDVVFVVVEFDHAALLTISGSSVDCVVSLVSISLSITES